MYGQRKDLGIEQARKRFISKYPYKIKKEYFDMGAWRKVDVAYADKKLAKKLLSNNKIKGNLERFRLVK